MANVYVVHPDKKTILKSWSPGELTGYITYLGSNYFMIANAALEDNTLQLWKSCTNDGSFRLIRDIAIIAAGFRGLGNNGKDLFLASTTGGQSVGQYNVNGDYIQILRAETLQV